MRIAGMTHKGRLISVKLVGPATGKQREYIHSLCAEIRDLLRFFIVEKENKYAVWPWPPDSPEWSDDMIAGLTIDHPELPKYYAGGVIQKLRDTVRTLRRKRRELYGE